MASPSQSFDTLEDAEDAVAVAVARCRRKLLVFMTLQFLLLWALLVVWTYAPGARDAISTILGSQHQMLYVPLLILLFVFLLLFCLRRQERWNKHVFLLFTLAESVLLAALDTIYESKSLFFNCGATCCSLALLLLLMRQYKKLHTTPAALLAFAVVALIGLVLFLSLGRNAISDWGFAISVVCQLLLMLRIGFRLGQLRITEHEIAMAAISTHVVVLLDVCTDCRMKNRPEQDER